MYEKCVAINEKWITNFCFSTYVIKVGLLRSRLTVEKSESIDMKRGARVLVVCRLTIFNLIWALIQFNRVFFGCCLDSTVHSEKKRNSRDNVQRMSMETTRRRKKNHFGQRSSNNSFYEWMTNWWCAFTHRTQLKFEWKIVFLSNHSI